jgi:hypothetical protein
VGASERAGLTPEKMDNSAAGTDTTVWSPDSSKIAFESNGDIYAVDVNSNK